MCVEYLTRDIENNSLYPLLISKVILILIFWFFIKNVNDVHCSSLHCCLSSGTLPLLAVSFSILWWINAAVKLWFWGSSHIIYYLPSSSIKRYVFLRFRLLMICCDMPRVVTTQPLTSVANTDCFSHLCIAAFWEGKKVGEGICLLCENPYFWKINFINTFPLLYSSAHQVYLSYLTI